MLPHWAALAEEVRVRGGDVVAAAPVPLGGAGARDDVRDDGRCEHRSDGRGVDVDAVQGDVLRESKHRTPG
jgi:hypothetical protein